jgi:hypothetical protein
MGAVSPEAAYDESCAGRQARVGTQRHEQAGAAHLANVPFLETREELVSRNRSPRARGGPALGGAFSSSAFGPCAYGSGMGHPPPVQAIRLWIDGEMGEFAMM